MSPPQPRVSSSGREAPPEFSGLAAILSSAGSQITGISLAGTPRVHRNSPTNRPEQASAILLLGVAFTAASKLVPSATSSARRFRRDDSGDT